MSVDDLLQYDPQATYGAIALDYDYAQQHYWSFATDIALDLAGLAPGMTVLDAGCGTGAFAIEAARRGAHVTAVDLSETLVTLARSRTPAELGSGRVRFLVGDMGEFRGHFDYTIAMDSLIHYPAHDIVGVLERLSAHTRHGVAFTFAPRTALLGAMHAVGRLFPRGDRAPAIEPVGHADLVTRLGTSEALRGWRVRHDELVKSGFYISHAMALGR